MRFEIEIEDERIEEIVLQAVKWCFSGASRELETRGIHVIQAAVRKKLAETDFTDLIAGELERQQAAAIQDAIAQMLKATIKKQVTKAFVKLPRSLLPD